MKLQLMKRTKDELKELTKLYGLKGVSKLNKDALCEELMPVILEEAINFMALFDDMQLKHIEHLVEQGEISDCIDPKGIYGFLENIGLAQISKDGIVTLPEEVRTKYKKHFEQDERIKEFSPKYLKYAKLRKYTYAAIHLYGIVEFSQLKALYEKYEGEALDEKIYFEWLSVDAHLGKTYDYMEGYIVAECLCMFEKAGFNELLENTAGKAYYEPSKEEFIRYSDEDYYEHTLHIERLKTHLKTVYKLDEHTVEEAIFDLCVGQQIATKVGDNILQHTLSRWNVMGITPRNMEEVNKLVGFVVKVMNTTRVWLNRGFTPDEIQGVASQQVNKTKVGRNESCPCGSGKKYKKCCGR